ncbi:MAG TPA: hypothetical protein PK634_14110, partial [Kiritimatiellia bacterium]|nr:hypothetical protein [Kiritimatiellia bacterium]
MEAGSLGEKVLDILLKRREIPAEPLREVRQEASTSGRRLEKLLVEKNLVSALDMTLALAEHLKLPPITLTHFTPSPDLLQILPMELLAQHAML